MDRRAFLGAVGGAAALAGCSILGSGGNGDGDGDAGAGSGIVSGADQYADPHAGHDWPTEPDPETAPEFDGTWPPGVDAGGMHDPRVFLRFHDVRVSRSPYVAATLEDTRVEHRPDGSTETDTVTESVYADVEGGRYYVESSRGAERYGADGVHHFRDVDGVVEASADRAHVTRRAVGGSIPYFHLTFRWTDAARRGDGSFTLSSDRPAGDGLPAVFRESWRGVPQEGSLSLGSDGAVTGWTLDSRQTFHRNGEQHTVDWTSENAVTYTESAPSGFPEDAPSWVSEA